MSQCPQDKGPLGQDYSPLSGIDTIVTGNGSPLVSLNRLNFSRRWKILVFGMFNVERNSCKKKCIETMQVLYVINIKKIYNKCTKTTQILFPHSIGHDKYKFFYIKQHELFY